MIPRKWPDDIDPTPGKRIGVVMSWSGTHGVIQALLANNRLIRVFVHSDNIVTNMCQPILLPGEEVEFYIWVYYRRHFAIHVSGPQNSYVQSDDIDANKFEVVLR